MGWISNIITVIGTLGGVFLGHYYAGKSQRDQWLRDNKRQEYRELLDTLSAAHLYLMTSVGLLPDGRVSERRPRPGIPEVDAYRIMRDRIFIAQEVKEKRIIEIWEQAVTRFDYQKIPIDDLTKAYLEVHDIIVQLAIESLS